MTTNLLTKNYLDFQIVINELESACDELFGTRFKCNSSPSTDVIESQICY